MGHRRRRRNAARALASWVFIALAFAAPAAASVEWSSYLGGSDGESGAALTLVDGDVVLVGFTTSDDFPVSDDAFDASRDPGGAIGRDAFVARMAGDGSALEYASYLGGSGEDLAVAVAVLPGTDTLVVVGQTDSPDFPGTAGGSFPSSGGAIDLFVARVDLGSGALLGATYLGGSANDFPRGLAVAPDGSFAVLGDTSSSDFPASAPHGDGSLDGSTDLFVASFDATGAFEGARFLGGSGDEGGGAIARGPGGDFWVVGWSTSSDFPVAPGSEPAGGPDALVARLSPDLATLRSAAFLGGAGDDRGRGVAITPDGATVIAFGTTESDDFPRTAHAGGATRRGRDLFVAKLDTSDLHVTASTLFGTAGTDTAYDVATDASGAVVVTGSGLRGGLATTPGAADLGGLPGCNPYCFSDAIVARLNTTLTHVQYATYLASSGGDGVQGVAGSVRVRVAGSSGGGDFPTTPGAYAEQANLGTSSAGSDAIAARLDLTSSTARVTVSREEIAWADLAGAEGYDVVVGDLGTLRAGGGWAGALDRCVSDSTLANSVAFGDTPTPGNGLWILVRAERTGTPTSYDAVDRGQRGTRDDGLSSAPAACPSTP